MYLYTIQKNAFGANLEQIAHLVSVLCEAAKLGREEISTLGTMKTSTLNFITVINGVLLS